MKSSSLLLAAALATGNLFAQIDRWELSETGGIRTDLAKLTQGKDHADHIEMAGRSVNAIIRWKISAAGRMDLDRWVRWPMLREKKDDTHASAAGIQATDDDYSRKKTAHRGIVWVFSHCPSLDFALKTNGYRILTA